MILKGSWVHPAANARRGFATPCIAFPPLVPPAPDVVTPSSPPKEEPILAAAPRMVPGGGECELFGLAVGRWTTPEFLEAVCGAAAESASPAPASATGATTSAAPRVVAYLNAHTTNLSQRNVQYRALLAAASTRYADGMSLVWASRFLRGAEGGLPERVNAGDFLPAVVRECARRGVRVYLLGGERGVARACADRLAGLAPGLVIAGASDGFWGRGGEFASEGEMIAAVAAARPHLLLLGLGSPTQEELAHRVGAAWGARVVWCVGALFEYYSGMRSRAPVWMRKLGLEWTWRLALEPRRLGRRYLWGNLEFLGHVLRERRRG